MLALIGGLRGDVKGVKGGLLSRCVPLLTAPLSLPRALDADRPLASRSPSGRHQEGLPDAPWPTWNGRRLVGLARTVVDAHNAESCQLARTVAGRLAPSDDGDGRRDVFGLRLRPARPTSRPTCTRLLPSLADPTLLAQGPLVVDRSNSVDPSLNVRATAAPLPVLQPPSPLVGLATASADYISPCARRGRTARHARAPDVVDGRGWGG